MYPDVNNHILTVLFFFFSYLLNKISTKRRNDILIGLNEVSDQFLPLLFHSLESITVLSQAKASIHSMRLYLLQHSQTISTMTTDQRQAYHAEETKIKGVSLIIADTLRCLEKFCKSMPLEWIMNPQHDFIAACFHLMREPTENINLLSVECLEQLAARGKLTYTQWTKWIQDLPQAVQQANQLFNTQETEFVQVEEAVRTGQSPTTVNIPDPLTRQLDFHRALSRMLATVVSSHIGLITQDKNLLKQTSATNGSNNSRNQNSENFAAYLRLLVDILHHPSGRVVGEQLNLWVTMLRDPQISKSTHTLDPLAADILTAFVNHMVKLEWDDVESESHPQYALLQASWEDDDEYSSWSNDYRSKSSILFKHMGNCQPHIACSVLSTRICSLIAQNGNGEPRDHLDRETQQLTHASEAVRQFEGVIHPLENLLNGLPSWTLNAQGRSRSPGDNSKEQQQQDMAIRAQTQSSLGRTCSCCPSLESFISFFEIPKSSAVRMFEALLEVRSFDFVTGD